MGEQNNGSALNSYLNDSEYRAACANGSTCVGINERNIEFKTACEQSVACIGMGKSALEGIMAIGDVKNGRLVDGTEPLIFSKIAVADFFGEIRDGAYELK